MPSRAVAIRAAAVHDRRRTRHAAALPSGRGEPVMVISFAHLQPLVALLAGILILLMPRLLNFIVAIYLIIVGVTGLWPHLLR
jgi:hypothetical protein